MIDICDFAVGLSRQLYGLTIATERPGHRMMETWHPLGVGRGDLGLQLPGRGLGVERLPRLRLRRSAWSGSRRRRRRSARPRWPALFARAAERFGDAPAGLLRGGAGRARGRRGAGRRSARAARLGDRLDRDGAGARPRASRRGSAAALLELGGNNAMIVAPSADLDLAERAIAFAAMGTAGPALHDAAAADRPRGDLRRAGAAAEADLVERRGRRSARAGHSGRAADRRGARSTAMQAALGEARAQGGIVHGGEPLDGYYVRPALVEMPAQSAVMRQARPSRRSSTCCATADARRGDRAPERGAAGPRLVDLHHRPARGRDLPLGRRLRLRHRQRQYRPVGRRDRRRVRRREGDRRRPRKRLGQPGAPICAAPPTRSITAASCRWPRASTSPSPDA